VPKLVGGSLLGRLPTAAAPLAIMLCALAAGATTTQAAEVAAVYGLAATVGQPLIGRLVDRHGQRGPLLGAACIATAALLAIPATLRVSLPAAVAAAAIAGMATPSIEGATRALWADVVPDPSLPAAFGLDVAAQSALFTAGPLLVTAVTNALGPTTALAGTAVIGLAGTCALVHSGPSRRWRPPLELRQDLLGPLRYRDVRRLTMILALVGAALGAQTVAGTAWAHLTGNPAAAGLVLASFSAGSCVGGLLYGRHTWRQPPQVRLEFLLVVFAAAWFPLTLCPPSITAMCLLAALPGLALSPLLGEAFQAIGLHVPRAFLTEANSWLVAGCGLGSAAGTAAAGAVADAKGPAAVYLAAALASGAAAATHHRLRGSGAAATSNAAPSHDPADAHSADYRTSTVG
jgi:predicted MFS family arabinose efflux permease